MGLPLFHQQRLGGPVAEAQLLVEAGAVGGHEINAFDTVQGGGGQQGLHDPAAEALAVQVAGYHHIPEHGAENAIAACPAESHQAFALPKAHHDGAAGQEAA